MRARDLFLALWTPDLFMQRVESDGDWTLMCPHDCPGLSDVYDTKDSKAFTELYESYEASGKGKKTLKARELYAEILESQIETGTPYILFKDAANSKSNQQNIGTIKSSNLCLVGETNIKIRLNGIEGEIRMDLLNELFKTNENLEVLSHNIRTKVNEWKLVTNSAMTNPKTNVLKITDEKTGKSIKCTPEHEVFTENRGYIMAKDLKSDDVLVIN